MRSLEAIYAMNSRLWLSVCVNRDGRKDGAKNGKEDGWRNEKKDGKEDGEMEGNYERKKDGKENINSKEKVEKCWSSCTCK